MMKVKIYTLLVMSLIHGLIMFAITYVMIAQSSHIFFSLNKLYMATLMTMPMIMLEILFMKSMYENKPALYSLFILAAISSIALFIAIRSQILITDRQFLQSMIPHHSSAIVMCKQNSFQNQKIADLCEEIVQTQEEEIMIMKEILANDF